VVHSDLLLQEGKSAVIFLPGAFNKSITDIIKKWKYDYSKHLKDVISKFVIVDESDPEIISQFVDIGKISELYDHRYGFEEYWREKLGENAVIDHVGSCATLIWEEYKKRANKKISEVGANLLYTAIVSNTLNFNASITNERDIKAVK
jgi:nanoRNase/pAp phosphatase (c-di-AMP/oligoRNAs hydrolase)